MPANYDRTNNHIIFVLCKKHKISKTTLVRYMGLTYKSLMQKINDPKRFYVGELIMLAGLLKVDYEYLLFYLIRKKSPCKKVSDKRDELKYIESNRVKYKFLE